MRNAVVIKTSGTPEVVDLDIVEDELAFLQGVVGGFIQAVPASDNATLWCNEEGKIMGLLPNYNAMSRTSAHEVLLPGDILAGDIVVTGGFDDEGETLGLSEEQVAQYLAE